MGFGSFLSDLGKGFVSLPENLYKGVIKPIGSGIGKGAQVVAKIPDYAWKEVIAPVGKGVFRGAESVGRVTIGIGKEVVDDVVKPVLNPIVNAGNEIYKDVVSIARPIAQGTGTALGGFGNALNNMNQTLLLAGGLIAVVVLLR